MYLIVGLGNPGSKYEQTRHNMGFDVIDKLVETHQIAYGGVRFHAMTGSGIIGGRKVLLMKPLTYMNLSGTAVAEAVNYYKLNPASDLVVISDDIDLPPGRIRIRKKGSAGGQNGLKHIVKCLGTEEFIRIRVGVGGKPATWDDLADWVLSRFTPGDRELVEEAQERAAKAVSVIVTEDVDRAMNLYNTTPDKKA